ncbi:hypothetical protein BCR35DRAFT_300612 [Leucosporidium creatinivorum]|uniref:GDSL lipase/esterase n=1 Tax=Leucosporidium creatinivorum TaxID=106004 RepID=A0A1Y2G127_9BASI|nr:hypothetical protein BCR35DRAFT_300612 [Leucosporidium creatinivorum]
MVFFGINDIGYSYLHGQWFPHLIDKILLTYEKQILRLYANGARHFLILNVPPTHKTPLVTSYGEQSIRFFESNVADWNQRLAHYVQHFHKRYPGAKATLFDTHSLYNTILASPAQHGISDSTNICPSYATINFDPLLHHPACKYPLGQHFWLSSYHSSWKVHQAMADAIVSTLADSSQGDRELHIRGGRRLDVH